MVTSHTGRVPWSLPGDFEHAMGVTLLEGSRVVAVVCPVASRITEEIAARLAGVIIYVASDDERRRVAHRCQPAQRIVVLPPGQPHGSDHVVQRSSTTGRGPSS
jgi:competence protein CoiA